MIDQMHTCANSLITSDTLIPHLLSKHPESRIVLDKLGLKGCGGPLGPHETLAYFARAHGVAVSDLLDEINAVIRQPNLNNNIEVSKPDIADTIYRPYFVAGILTILTMGATWGAILLWRIGMNSSFQAAPKMEIHAHAQAQIYGWMGFFIMGFAYQAFPRFWHTALVKPAMAMVVFSLLFTGVFLSAVTMPFAGSGEWPAALASWAALCELLSVVLFSGQIYWTFKSSAKKLEPYIAFVFVALFWFIVSSLLNLYTTFELMGNSSTNSAPYLSFCQTIMRDMQIHGMGLTMILGVSLRTLPGLFGLPEIPAKRAVTSLILLTAGVLGETIAFAPLQNQGNSWLASAALIAHLAILFACLLLVIPFALWRPFPEADRATKYIRAAYLWLFISLFMLVGAPFYGHISGNPDSHAYAGAVRHAITVGFISLMIMGYSSKVVPTLNGINPATLGRLYAPFVLVNCGCALRVLLQTGTDWSSGCFPLIGLSGTMEVLGLVIWGLHLLRSGLIATPKSIEAATPKQPEVISKDCIVAHVLDWYPGTEAIFIAHGFTALKNPILRKTLASQVSIAQACRMRQTDAEVLIRDLNQAVRTATNADTASCNHHEK